MSDSDAYRDEMARLSKLSERDLDRILAGRGSADEGDPVGDLVGFVRSIRAAGGASPAPVEDRHLAAIVETSRLLAEKGEPAARPASKAHEPVTQAFGLPKWRRKLMPAGLFASLAAKITGVALAATVATGGLAAAGALPDPAQEVAHDVLGAVGITVPSGHDGDHEFSPSPLEDGSTASENASDTAKGVLTVVDGWMAGLYDSGCEFGRAVAAAAGADTSNAAECPETGDGITAAGSETGEEKSAAGKAKGQEKAAAGKAKGDDASSAGKSTADDASGGKSTGGASSGGASTGSDASSGGKSTAEGASSGGSSTGQDAADSGPSNNPTGKP